MKRKSRSSDQTIRAAFARRGFTNTTIGTLMHARKLLMLAVASAFIKLADSPDIDHPREVENRKLRLKVSELEERLHIVESRMSRIDAKHRSRYTPEERFNILVHKETYSLSLEDTASLFLVSMQTIKRWYNEALREPQKKTIGSLLKAVPPLMRYSDVTRDLIRLMDQMGFGGCKRIAQSLTRAGIKLSRETVRRCRKEPRKPEPRPETKTIGRTLRAKRPNHIWMLDITEIPSMFRLFSVKFVVLLDVFSRFPIAAKLFFKEPIAKEISDLVRSAAKKRGKPSHFISDQGKQFTSDLFRRTLKRLGIKQRFGAIGKYGSISTIERLWRTLKDLLLLRSRRAWTPAELMRRLNDGLYYYAFHKPHQGLNGATPAEVYFGFTPAHTKAKRPLREFELKKATRNQCDEQLFEIAYLDPEHLLPVLVPKKKAA